MIDDLKKRRPSTSAWTPSTPTSRSTRRACTSSRRAARRESRRRRAISPIHPFETPYSWVVHVDLDDDSIERVRELYAAEITFIDEWIGRLMNKLADEKLLDETVVYYMSDHGLTLGENGVMGKDGARAQWHIYHVPALIRHPEGKLAGQTSDYFASTHDVPRTLLSFMGVRAPGMMEGEDLSVLFEGGAAGAPVLHLLLRQLPALRRPRLVPAVGQRGRRKRLYDKRNDPRARRRAEHPEIVDRLWRVLEDEAGGTLPQFGSSAQAVIGVSPHPAFAPPPRRTGLARRGCSRAWGVRRAQADRFGQAKERDAGRAAADASDYVKAFKDQLRHEHAQPQRADRPVAALRPRRAEVHAGAAGAAHARDGMRSCPFRMWRRTDGMPDVPGYCPVWDWQPVVTETARLRGVRTSYVTDNPIIDGPRFPDVVRPGGTPPEHPRARPEGGDRRDQAPVGGGRAHLPRRHRRAAQARTATPTSSRSTRSTPSTPPRRRRSTSSRARSTRRASAR